MENKALLKLLIKNTEERVSSYKILLEDTYKSKLPNTEDTDYYKSLLRDSKNFEEVLLKKYREELTYLNQELNPPFCYPY